MVTGMTLAALAASSALPAGASGAVISHSASKPFAPTSWSQSFLIPQFDTMGGDRILEQVNIFLDGMVRGTARAESINAGPATVTLNLSSSISLSQGVNTLAVALPLASVSYLATTYDGTMDFGGTSGRTFAGLAANDSDSSTLVAGVDDLSAWIGTGNVTLSAVANGASTGSGAGNLALIFNTDASTLFQVDYVYSEVPAPGGAGLAGLTGLAALRRRRR